MYYAARIEELWYDRVILPSPRTSPLLSTAVTIMVCLSLILNRNIYIFRSNLWSLIVVPFTKKMHNVRKRDGPLKVRSNSCSGGASKGVQMRSAFLIIPALLTSSLFAQGVSSDDRIKPEQLGLPKETKRTSEPFVTRIYKTDDAGTILKNQPKGYPFTITEDYILKDGEESRSHQGVDFSPRPTPDEKPTPLDFKAGVHGIIVKAGDGPWGTITVQVWDGTLIQYLDGTASHVKVGDIVAPDTKLRVTGRTGAGVIHLHIQAKDKFGNAISPDLAFRLGQKNSSRRRSPT